MKTIADVIIFGPGLWTLLVVVAIVGVVLYLFREGMEPMLRKVLIAVVLIVFILWLLSLVSGAPVWVR